MREQDISIEKLFGLDSFQQFVDSAGEIQFLLEDRFKLKDLNVSARVLGHWKKLGLLPEKRKPVVKDNEWVENDSRDEKWQTNWFNFFEYIYLLIIQDLRSFGFPTDKLRMVKDTLMQKIDFVQFLSNITPGLVEELENRGEDAAFIKGFLEYKEEILDGLKDMPEGIIQQFSLLNTVVLGTIMKKADARIIVTSEGVIDIVVHDHIGDHTKRPKHFLPVIEIPLLGYLQHFISRSQYKDLLVPYGLITDQEKLILDHIRSGKYKEIKIKINRRNVERLEFTEERKTDHSSRIEELLMQGGYQEIHIKTENGEIRYSAVVTKKKI